MPEKPVSCAVVDLAGQDPEEPYTHGYWSRYWGKPRRVPHCFAGSPSDVSEWRDGYDQMKSEENADA